MVRQYSYSVSSMHEVFQVSSRSDVFGRCSVGTRWRITSTPLFF